MEKTMRERAFRTLDKKTLNILLKVCTAITLVSAFLLTFTVSDYFIFNRFSEYGFFFCLSQWVKKAGLILLPLAIYFNCKRCGDVAKYILPVFIILSCFIYGDFFDAEVIVEAGDINGEIFKNVNSFFPKWLNVTLFFVENVFMAICCALLFLRDGYKIKLNSLYGIPLSLVASMPLNIFENFFDIDAIAKDSFLRFYNFTIWHFLALLILVASTVGAYLFLKNKSKVQQDKYLVAIAVTLLLQYHSKDSVVLGDGYNVYNTIFACLPLFICNIGVYVASLSVILKKKALYSISFFIHAIGALTVFIYFGKDSMSNYGIFASYSILYFCLTHALLFILCVIPTALGHFKFELKKCWIPLVYYFIVIICASLASGIVSDLSTKWTTADGQHLVYDDFLVTGSIDGQNVLGSAGFMRPNYAFTQVNPLPFEVPNLIPLGGFMRYINMFYVLLVYLSYVGLFFGFYGLYRAYIAVFAVAYKKLSSRPAKAIGLENVAQAVNSESAVAEDLTEENEEGEEDEEVKDNLTEEKELTPENQ
ncbi:MAG: hypothetical protein ACI4MS_02255 [Candidatus Coproplasma sp.]